MLDARTETTRSATSNPPSYLASAPGERHDTLVKLLGLLARHVGKALNLASEFPTDEFESLGLGFGAVRLEAFNTLLQALSALRIDLTLGMFLQAKDALTTAQLFPLCPMILTALPRTTYAYGDANEVRAAVTDEVNPPGRTRIRVKENEGASLVGLAPLPIPFCTRRAGAGTVTGRGELAAALRRRANFRFLFLNPSIQLCLPLLSDTTREELIGVATQAFG